MVRIWTDDGVDGTGRSYTIGTGGSAVVALLRDYMAPWRLGRDAAMVEEILARTIFLHSRQLRGATREPCLRGRGHCETVGSQSGNKDVALETLV
jgi:L-alanine-DL-glutamate epimerase-like enolase superfamily enzyme